MRTNKKEEERKVVKRFLNSYFEQNLKYEVENSDPPDFILSLENDRIGIELTEIFIDDKLKEKESILETIFANTIEQLNQIDIPILLIFPLVNEKIKLREKDKKIISMELADLIIRNIPEGNDVLMLSNHFYKDNFPNLTKIIYGLSIKRNYLLDRHFISLGAYWIQSAFESVKSAIEKKVQKLENYKEKVSTNWLLIYFTPLSQASAFHLDDITIARFDSKFDKIFIFDMLSKKYQELK